MSNFFLILGLFVATSLAMDCWKTGCQPNDWAVTGCAQYGRHERGRDGCRDNRGVKGYRYDCCVGSSSGGGTGGGKVLKYLFKLCLKFYKLLYKFLVFNRFRLLRPIQKRGHKQWLSST